MSIFKKEFIKREYFIAIICVAFIALSFISYKLYYLKEYNLKDLTNYSYDELVEMLEYKDTMKITTKELKKGEKYLKFENVKIRNDFKKYKEFSTGIEQEDYKSYKLALYDKSGKVIKASFWISKWNTLAYFIRQSRSLELFALGEDIVDENEDPFYRNLLIDNNINSDIELLEFLKNDPLKKVNIFSSKYDIKKLYAKTLFITVAIPEVNSITKLEGDYNGYIIKGNNIKEVNIEIGDDKYYLTFIDKDGIFTDVYINDLLNTLVIE